MKIVFRTIVLVLIGVGMIGIPRATAEEEMHDLVTAYLVPGADAHQAVVEVWMSNVNPVIGVTLPFKFAAGDSLVMDSLVTSTGLAKNFAVVKPVFKAENQTLLVNMLWATMKGTQTPPIPPGEGLLAQIYLHTPGKFPMKEFRMAAVQLPPENVLMFVTQTLNPVTPDFVLSESAPPKVDKAAGKADGSSPK